MKCFVSGCDTDDNVVSYTSVFYVNCPTDPTIQQQWFSLLSLTDPEAMQALVDGQAKVCSCHFTEQSFGHHPVYGYRYLLSTALPTIFPPKKETEELKPVIEDLGKENPLDYYFVYLEGTPEPALIQQTSLGDVIGMAGLDLIENLTALDAKLEEKVVPQSDDTELVEKSTQAGLDGEEDDDDAIEQIGIEYANGKYYFLNLDDDPDGDDLVSAEDGTENEEFSTSLELKDRSETATKVNADPDSSENEQQEDVGADEYEVNVGGNHFPKMLRFEIREEREEHDGEEIEATGDSEGAISKENPKMVPTKEEYQSCSEGETEKADNEFSCEALSEADYGPIEALEEVSVCGDTVRIRDMNEGKDRFVCEFCGRGFPYKSFMERHALIHTKMKKFFCEICGKGFSQKINLNIHMRTHTGERPNKKYACQICGKKCIRLSELETHLTVHLRKFPHVCPLCAERYSEVTGFFDHFRAEHQHEMTVSELINLLIQNQNALVISDKEEPAIVRRTDGLYECPVCGKMFRYETFLERHKRKMHMKIFNCPHCPRKFLYKSLLTKHLPTHTHEKPYPCQHCHLSYTQRVNLRVHMERKHPEQQEIEPSLFIVTENIEEEDDDDGTDGADGHRLSTKQPIMLRTYDCELCGKRFLRSQSLLQHVIAHKREPNPVTYDCDVCGISLSANVALKKHRWRLHGEPWTNTNKISNFDLGNVATVPPKGDQYEVIDVTNATSEEYENEY